MKRHLVTLAGIVGGVKGAFVGGFVGHRWPFLFFENPDQVGTLTSITFPVGVVLGAGLGAKIGLYLAGRLRRRKSK